MWPASARFAALKLIDQLKSSVWARRAALMLAGAAIALIGSSLKPVEIRDSDGEPIVSAFASCPEKLVVAERERRMLREEAAYLKQSVIIEQEACFNVRESIKSHEDEVAKLHEQLAFYRGIVSPEQDAGGLRIHKLEIFDAGRRDWQYRLTLIQAVRQAQDAKGLVKINIEGLQNDVFQGFSMKELDPSDHHSGFYDFRYYAELHGQFRLPRGFKPLRIVVEVIPKQRNAKAVKRTWVWQEVIAASNADTSKL